MDLKIEGVSYRPSVPVTVMRTLDESLDTAHAVIPYADRSEPFTPFSIAEMDGERWLIAADTPTQVKGLRGKWRHDVTLVEETKRLETMFISSKVITKHDYREFVEAVRTEEYSIVAIHDPSASGYQSGDITATDFVGTVSMASKTQLLFSSQTVRGKGDYTESELSALADAVGVYSSKPYYVWVEADGVVKYRGLSPVEPLEIDVPFGQLGDHIEVHYFMGQTQDVGGNPMIFYEIKYEVIPSVLVDRTENKSAREIVEELIADAEQLRYGDKPRIKLSDEEASKLDKIEAPEDSFSSGMTLFEALSKVGDWDGISGIPKLSRDVLTFERLGGAEIVTLGGREISVSDAYTAEDYCSTLESASENMIDEDGNALSDPFDDGFRTVRTEDGNVIIEDGTISIYTAFPIWKVTSLTVGYIGGKINDIGGDITPYVFEKSEYDLLSEFTKAGFPNSKAYAVYYTKGSAGIHGLSYTPRDLSSELINYKYNAIEYILKVKFGVNPGLKSEDIVNMSFKVSYIPFISTRIRQHKMFANGIEAGMAYGQGGSVISARTYGEHLRARAQMMGLPERTVQLIYGKDDKLPRAGQRVNNTDYIGTVTVERYPSFNKVQLTLSPNYNRLNRFISIKKDLRQYEIPMDGCTERNVISEDFIVLGDMEGRFESMMTDAMKSAFMSAIMGDGTSVEVKAAVLTSSNEPNKTDGVQVILPVAKMPVGNSTLMYTRYKDNYSAGPISEPLARLGESRRLQRDVQYTDTYGNVKYLHVDLVASATLIGDADHATAGHDLPLTQGTTIGKTIVTTSKKPILLNKDARESISLAYQVHIVSNTDIIIGTALASRAPWISSEARSAPMVYVYNTPINPITGEDSEPDVNGRELVRAKFLQVDCFEMPSVPPHVSWAVKQDGVFLFGANSPMPERVFVNFRDKPKEVGADDEDEIKENVFVNFNIVNATHINLTDYVEKGGTFYDSMKAYSGHILPSTITVKKDGSLLPSSKYKWYRKTGTIATLEIPNVDGEIDIEVIATRNLFTVDIEFEYWDEWGNDKLYTEHLRGTYLYGVKLPIPEKITHQHEGEERVFILQQSPFTVVVDDNIKMSVTYHMEEPPQMYLVEIESELWDEWGNDKLYVEKDVGMYYKGDVIDIPKTKNREHGGDMRTFTMKRDAYSITVTGNIKHSADYYLNAEPKYYTVDIEYELCNEWGDTLYTEYMYGRYPEGHIILVTATRTHEHNGEIAVFELGADSYTITVRGDIKETIRYYLRVSDPDPLPTPKYYNVNIELEYWDEWGNQKLFVETISGEYKEGKQIIIPAIAYREYNGDTREFALVESSTEIVINVTSDITAYYTYNMIE